MLKRSFLPSMLASLLATATPAVVMAQGSTSHYEQLANIPYVEAQISKENTETLMDELQFQRAVQLYLWALPSINMYGMKEGAEKYYGKGYNVLTIFKERLNAKTLITTPNSDVIYALGFLDLKEDGPLVIEAPQGLQGILDDYRQRPICSEGEIDGKVWCGDVGLVGPDKGKGAKYLILPPDYKGDIPQGYLVYRSRTYGVFVFWRGFFKDPKQLEAPVKVMEQTRIYPLGKKDSAKPMQFPDGSKIPANLLYPTDGSAFELYDRFIQHEYVDPADFQFRGMAAEMGIIKGKPFQPDEKMRKMLDLAAKTAHRMGYALMTHSGRYYTDRQWVPGLPVTNDEFGYDSYTDINHQASYFTYAYSTSPAMFLNMEGMGAKYPTTFFDANGDALRGEKSYKLNLPANIPAKLFWSVTAYNPENGAGLDNGQPFPSLNKMDKPIANADGSYDIYFGPTSPGPGKNWIRTVPGKGFFANVRLYAPTKTFFDQTWRPSDLEPIK